MKNALLLTTLTAIGIAGCATNNKPSVDEIPDFYGPGDHAHKIVNNNIDKVDNLTIPVYQGIFSYYKGPDERVYFVDNNQGSYFLDEQVVTAPVKDGSEDVLFDNSLTSVCMFDEAMRAVEDAANYTPVEYKTYKLGYRGQTYPIDIRYYDKLGQCLHKVAGDALGAGI